MTNPSTTPQAAIITMPTTAERNGDFRGWKEKQIFGKTQKTNGLG
jgi:hypothetical protein